MNERVVYHTGDWVPVSKAGIHIYDSQSFFGDGIFEMVRTFNQEYFILEILLVKEQEFKKKDVNTSFLLNHKITASLSEALF